ncbi:MAG: cyclopropane-fatty-acyl-phospholipid synthase family protein [Verrucomicrobiota bacterium JB022]|nr:cyclopropane-fatty-acyl-phospholipid synthase family protein [Verrucomicrobiota bacterium JB022]
MSRLLAAPFWSILKQFRHGHLKVVLPDGKERHFGQPPQECAPYDDPKSPVAELQIRDDRFFRYIVWGGEIGFGEAYMAGLWDSPDVTHLLRFFLANIDTVPGFGDAGRKPMLFNLAKGANWLKHLGRRNSRENSKRNIEEHYDLSNEFYHLWLDETWSYSSAYFPHPEMDLAEAQREKYRRLCRKLQLKPGMKVLEIGCGWGGFALTAAREFGCHVKGITISEAQFEVAVKRVNEAGLNDRIHLDLIDYRDVQGQFDAIVSIEMLEAVGHEYLKTFFTQCHRLLAPHGVLGLQVILAPDSRYEEGRKQADFIKKHVFPGGQLPSLTAMQQAMLSSGELFLQHLETFGQHYARTLRCWRDQFEHRLHDVKELGFDQPFIRKWRYYLCYCEAAFAMRSINVGQMVYTRPNNPYYFTPEELDGLHAVPELPLVTHHPEGC